MSNLFHLLNRSVTKSRWRVIGPSMRFLFENRVESCNAHEIHGRNRKRATTAPLVRNKVQITTYATINRFRLGQDKVLMSGFEDVTIPEELLHQYIWKNLARWPDKIATVCSTSGKSYTYSQLRKLSGKFASSLVKFKLYPGSTIAVVIPNILEFPIIILGASEAGVIVTLSNPISTAQEIGRQLLNSEASAVITIPEIHSVIKKSISENPNIKLPVIVVDDGNNSLPDGTIRFSELIADSVQVFDESTFPARSNEDTVLLPYSSGTTGLPKGVELTHRNIVGNCEQIHVEGIHPGYETTDTHQDVIPVILPLFHAYSLVVVLLNYLSLGGKLVFLRNFSLEGTLRCLKDFRSNLLYVAPPLVLFLGNSEMATPDHFQSLKYVMTGAAPIGSESVQRLLAKSNQEMVLTQGYGLTETSPVVSLSDNGLDNLDAVGYVVPNTEIRVVGIDESNVGLNMGVNETGELYVKGPQVMKGYFKNPEATAKTMDGEWLKTGDLGCYDETGHIIIKDRLKELIKVKGFQVAPAELEETLRSNVSVLDAAVTAEAHPRFGEIPKAFVVLKPGIKLDEDDLKKFVSERVAKYKQLGSVKFVDSIPKSNTGKILRGQLKDL